MFGIIVTPRLLISSKNPISYQRQNDDSALGRCQLDVAFWIFITKFILSPRLCCTSEYWLSYLELRWIRIGCGIFLILIRHGWLTHLVFDYMLANSYRDFLCISQRALQDFLFLSTRDIYFSPNTQLQSTTTKLYYFLHTQF